MQQKDEDAVPPEAAAEVPVRTRQSFSSGEVPAPVMQLLSPAPEASGPVQPGAAAAAAAAALASEDSDLQIELLILKLSSN